jgi:RsiW-degrading membrane proteinase PrsW (M82 family)
VGSTPADYAGSFARTTRARTVLAGMAVGLYLCAPLALLLQWAWIRPAALLAGASVHSLLPVASYTADPFIEEVIKVLPLALLLMIPAIRRQWSVTDCVLIGAAAGSGFRLAEDIYRFGASAGQAVSNGSLGGWMLPGIIGLAQATGGVPPSTVALTLGKICDYSIEKFCKKFSRP